MKKLLAGLIAVLMLFTVVGCDLRSEAESSKVVLPGVKLLSGKDAKGLYDSSIKYLEALENFEMSVVETYNIKSGEKTEEYSNTTQYNKSGQTLSYLSDAKDGKKQIIYDGEMLYWEIGEKKEKSKMSYENFIEEFNTFLDEEMPVKDGMLLNLSDSNFENKRFISEGDLYTLTFAVTPEEYETLLGKTVEAPVDYKVYFDTAGRIVCFELSKEYYNEENALVKYHREVSVNNVGSVKSISAPEDTEGYVEIIDFEGEELLSGKTPKELYHSAIEYIKTLENFEITIESTQTSSYEGDTEEQSSTTVYTVADKTLANFYKSGEYEEHLIYDGETLYQQLNGIREKRKLSYDELISRVGNVVESGFLIELEDSNFEGKRFVEKDDLYVLKLVITPEEYQTLFGGTIESPAAYDVYFDEQGNFVYFERYLEYYYYGTVLIEDFVRATLDKVGTVEKISAPADAESYATRPTAEEIDLTPVESLDGFEDADKITDYVLMSFKIDNYVANTTPESTETTAETETNAETETTAEIETNAETETTAETEAYEGSILIRLYPDVAPATVANFQNLVGTATYNGLVVNAIIKDFAFQIGDPIVSDSNAESETENVVEPIFGEFASNGFSNNLSHKRGVVSMLRGEDPDSATYPFFICTADSVNLDGAYASFGSVVYGLDVIDVIAGLETDDNGVPTSTVTVTSARFVTPKAV